jgi:hypothetical protein
MLLACSDKKDFDGFVDSGANADRTDLFGQVAMQHRLDMGRQAGQMGFVSVHRISRGFVFGLSIDSQHCFRQGSRQEQPYQTKPAVGRGG